MQSYEFNVSYNVINAPFKAVKVVVLSWHEMQFDKKRKGCKLHGIIGYAFLVINKSKADK